MTRNRMTEAFDLGGRDAYIHFGSWNDDLERRMMADWIAETKEESWHWLEIRDAAMQGWEQRQQAILDARIANIEEVDYSDQRERLVLRAHAFGADPRYQRFPIWSDDLEYKLKSDWNHTFGGVGWLDVREEVKSGWVERRESEAHG
jgi:hypothetical protein